MGHTLLCVLGLFLMNTLFKHGHAEAAQKVNTTLRADQRTIAVGGNVMLTCSVDADDSSGWKYQWFRRTTNSFEEIYMENGKPDQNSTIRITKGGVYRCRGGRGDSLSFTEDSNIVTIHKIVYNRAVVTLQPNWLQIFSGETITLRCEIQRGEGTEWKYEWMTPTSNLSLTNNEYKISKALASNNGDYSCKSSHRGDLFSSTNWSETVALTVFQHKPKAKISADKTAVPVGGNVTLTCTVKPSSGWKYYWYRGKKNSEPVFHSSAQISISQGGLYWCRGGRGNPVYYAKYSDSINLNKLVTNRAVVTLQPNWPKIYTEETVALKCDINDGEDIEWEYEWQTSSSSKPPKQRESLLIAYTSHSGDYRCKGRKKSEQTTVTEWSDAFKLMVYDKPQPVLTVSPLWLSPEASVNLSCEVENPSAGWRFYWYKAVPKLADNSYSDELLPGSSSGTEQDSYIVHGQPHTAGYKCRAGRGDRVYYTQYSEPKFVLSGDFRSSASVTVSPDRVQHFPSDSVSLNCEGNSAEWRVRRFTEKDSLLDYSDWGTMTGATCNIHRLQEGNTVYWCESGSGQYSNAVNITAQKKDIILVSPVHPVIEGDSVSLCCKLKTGRLDSDVFFYRNDKLIQNDTRGELNISAVSKSDEGFYKCQYSGKESLQSWLAVKSSGSSSLVPVFTGLLAGIIMIILLLLLCHYKKAKDLCCDGPIQSLSTNQGSATDQTVNQDETQQHVYSSLFHGDVSIYESVKGSENTRNGGTENEYSNVTFQLKGLDKNSKHDDPVESSDYYNLNLKSATGTNINV